MPDDELLTLAEAGTLTRSADAGRAGHRMMTDERVGDRRQFAGRWAGDSPNPRRGEARSAKVPRLEPELRDAMKQETRLFFDAMLRENRPMSEFLDARYTFLNERLAKDSMGSRM